LPAEKPFEDEAEPNATVATLTPGKGPVWKMAPDRSSTLKLRKGETEARQGNPLEQARRCRAMSAATEQRDREFADSPLEESGFEPLVPLAPKNGSDAGERDERIAMSPRIDKQSVERWRLRIPCAGPSSGAVQPGEAEYMF
jgi:hypothetical protein